MKKLWHQNKIFIILMSIVLVCFIIMSIFLAKLFFKSTGDKYGDRLDNIRSVKVSDQVINNAVSELEKSDNIKDATISVSGGNIYISLKLTGVANLEDAKNFAVTALGLFSDKIKEKYDFQFILSEEKTDNNEEIKIMGSKNANGTGLVWNNNTPIKSEESEQ